MPHIYFFFTSISDQLTGILKSNPGHTRGVFFKAAHLACSIPTVRTKTDLSSRDLAEETEYLSALCHTYRHQDSASSRAESAQWYTDFYSTPGWRPGSLQAEMGGGNGLTCKPFRQCSLQENITKHWSPVPPDFSISTTLSTASKLR